MSKTLYMYDDEILFRKVVELLKLNANIQHIPVYYYFLCLKNRDWLTHLHFELNSTFEREISLFFSL